MHVLFTLASIHQTQYPQYQYSHMHHMLFRQCYMIQAQGLISQDPKIPFSIYNHLRMNTNTLIIIVLLAAATLSTGVPPCPRQYDLGSVFSAQIIISNFKGLIPLVQNQDIQCYNYTLPYQFARVPEVAIAVPQFDSYSSDDLFFAIKTIKSDSVSSVPFVIRTHWRYTKWTKIVFSFLAQDRKQLQSGYYQVDTGSLGSCQIQKKIQVLLPFRTICKPEVNYNLFLHGFQISTQKYSEEEISPYQIHVTKSHANSSGISILLSLTTITKVHAILISYVAYEETTLSIVRGNYIFDGPESSNVIEHVPYSSVGRNYARIHGITGFIINHKYQAIHFLAKWSGTRFIFDLGLSQQITQYLSYQYIFFTGSQCSDCPGYPLTFERKCVKFCPPNYFATPEKVCLTCGDGQRWNGTACQKSCPVGQFLNIATNQCECPAGLHWNGQICLSCNSGKIYNPDTKMCECRAGQKWNGYSCAKVPQCTDGRQWNVYTYTCECPLGSKWNGTYCRGIQICYNGKVLNQNYECECPQTTFWNGNWCEETGCLGGQIWNGSKCICKGELHFNGTICIQCINGQIWQVSTKTCRCERGYRWNGNFCQRWKACSGGRVYNTTFEQCVCKDGFFWNGFACMIKPDCCCGKRWNQKLFKCECPQSFNWDGSSCIQCINGKIWDNSTQKCICKHGTQWNGQFCVVIQQCLGGMMWNQNTWTCQCPSITVWNGNYCITNPCQGGKIWDNLSKQCLCAKGKVFKHGSCVPQQTSCENGKIWNPKLFSCKCPQGKWDNGTVCVNITICQSNQIYNPLNNKCQCQLGLVWLQAKHSCADPTCPHGQRWDGYGCVQIVCPPSSYYNGSECICPDPRDKCNAWEYFNGVQCVYFPEKCPQGTYWNKTNCVPFGNQCPIGYYGQSNDCKQIPQRCAPTTVWVPQKKICKPERNNCPQGTYLSGSSCQPYTPCTDGKKWNPSRFLCLCPNNTEWNGKKCIPCLAGKYWLKGVGCQCPEGKFYSGAVCDYVSYSRCVNIPNSVWENGKCICKPGYDTVGLQCICQGVQIKGKCHKCIHRPHSVWKYGECHCKVGYTLLNGECKENTQGNDDPTSCNVGTYFDNQQKKCLACPDGCLSCEDCYTCLQCKIDFNYDPTSQLCIEHCGDGKRFISECDDGNNQDGDGCSLDCRVEPGYTCVGGSPNDKDACFIYYPSNVTLIQTGQIRYEEKIVLNIKLDYLPQNLLQSTDCNDRCSSVLVGRITRGDSGAVSIKSTFIPGSSYSFSMQINFERNYIGKFTIQIQVNPKLGDKYFKSIGISQKLVVNVVPGYLSKVNEQERVQ